MLLVKFPSDEARIVYVGTGTAAQVLREEIHTPLKTLFEKAKQTKNKQHTKGSSGDRLYLNLNSHYATLIDPRNGVAALTASDVIEGWEFVIHLAEQQLQSIENLRQEVSDYKCGFGLWIKEKNLVQNLG